MQFTKLIPVAVLAFAVACSDSDTATSPTSVPGPLFDVAAPSGPYGNEVSFTSANSPGGTHIQSGTIFCFVSADLSVTCSSTGPYELAGVGHTNAHLLLEAVYSADVLCNNPAGGKNKNNAIEPHQTTFAASFDQTLTSRKNGRLTVNQATVSPGGTAEDLCPNSNWGPQLQNLQLESFSYTLTFEGFEGFPAVRIDQP